MKRSSNKKSGNHEAILIRKQTLDKLLREKSAGDMIALYCFYSYTALWQRTNQPRATVAYAANGLHWGKDKVRAVRLLLRNLGMIEDVRVFDPRTKRVTGWFVRVAYFHPTCFPHYGVSQRVECKHLNALRAGNRKTRGAVKQTALRAGTPSNDGTRPAQSAPRAPSLPSLYSLDGYSEDELEVIKIYQAIVATGSRWLPVNRFSKPLSAAIQDWFAEFRGSTMDDLKKLFTAAAENDDRIRIPHRKSLVRLLRENPPDGLELYDEEDYDE